MNINILVYGSTKKVAISKLQDILDNLRYGDISKVKRNSSEFVVILKYGTMYKAVGASESSRGQKWQFAYIDGSISKEIVDNVIFPSFYSETSKLIDSYTYY